MKAAELANLDALRTYAVSTVVAAHVAATVAEIRGQPVDEHYVALGQLGVLAFFVHTSYVLMCSLERLGHGHTARRFYVRRAFRIYPLAVLAVVAVVVFRIPIDPTPGQEFRFPSPAVLAGNLLLIQNFVGKESILSPLWSLPFEVEMYVALPMLFTVALMAKGVRYLGVLIASSVAIGLLVFAATGHAQILAYIPCFLAGVLAYALRDKVRPFISSALWPVFLLAWFGVTSLLMPPTGIPHMLVSWAACLFLGFSIGAFRDSTARVWNRMTQQVAKYSYGIYLSHVPAIWLAFGYLGEAGTTLKVLASLLITAAVSVAAFHLVESPMIEVGRRLSQPRRQT